MSTILVTSLVSVISDPIMLGLIFIAVLCGIFFGIVPGLGGKLGIVLMIPVMVGIDPTTGLIFLVAMHAVVHTAGAIPSILFGVPGTGPNAATIIDGHPLAQQGQAGRALGASLFSSAAGGIVGALFLLLMLPLLRPLILQISPAEYFLLAVLGISFISAVSGDSLRKGIIVGCFGLCLSYIGLAPQTGEPRYTFGQLFLWDGVDFVTAILGIFAIPEMIALGVKGGSISKSEPASMRYNFDEVFQGIRDVFRYRWLALRTSIMGAVVGIIPGLGGDVASWLCYGHAVQSSTTPERFGKGAIEGVIAPETASNSKEGGALLPTLLLGVPGSSGMAILLGAFIILGIQPGPQILTVHLDLIGTLVTTLVLANIISVVILLLVAKPISGIATLPGGLIIPFVFVFILMGSYFSSLNWQNFFILIVLGVLGYGLRLYNWPRPPFVIGLALGRIAETSLLQAYAIWGYSFLLRPLSILLLCLIALSIVLYYWRRKNNQRLHHVN